MLDNTKSFVQRLVGPLARLQSDGPVSDVLSIHLLHGFPVVVRVEEAHEAEALALIDLLVLDDFTLGKASVLFESRGQYFLRDLVSHVAAVDPVVVLRPVSKGLVDPLFSADFAVNLKGSLGLVGDLLLLLLDDWLLFLLGLGVFFSEELLLLLRLGSLA